MRRGFSADILYVKYFIFLKACWRVTHLDSLHKRIGGSSLKLIFNLQTFFVGPVMMDSLLQINGTSRSPAANKTKLSGIRDAQPDSSIFSILKFLH